MTLFKSFTARDIWVENWCDRCWREPNECTILTKAITSDRKPREWDRNQRAQLMQDAYRCNAFDTRPPVLRRAKAEPEDISMFDVEPQPYLLVPVDDWPDKPTPNEVEHQ